MHFIVVGPMYHHYSESVVRTWNQLGHTAVFFPEMPFYENCSYLQRKLYKFGYRTLKMKWEKDWQKRAIRFGQEHAGKYTVFLCLTGGMITDGIMDAWEGFPIVLCMWDSIRRYDISFQKRLQRYTHVFAFEYEDMAYAEERFSLNMNYLPLGYDETAYYPQERDRDIDVAFVGTPLQNRLDILERVAQYISTAGGDMCVAGRWYDDTYPWKKRLFRKKHPALTKYLMNCNIPPTETAEIYRRSKIVLNINNDVHRSISPRTFEILATKTFQLMNEGQKSYGTIDLERDLVLYKDGDDLLEKIDRYLKEPEQRNIIAAQGYADVQKFSMRELMRKMLRCI